MKRLLRIIANMLTVLSLALCAATVLLRARSGSRCESIMRGGAWVSAAGLEQRLFTIISHHGWLAGERWDGLMEGARLLPPTAEDAQAGFDGVFRWTYESREAPPGREFDFAPTRSWG